MFDPSKYSKPSFHRQPVVLLLDVSGSMDGEKIENLYDAVVMMVDSFVKEAISETEINVAIFTFGGNGGQLHTPYTPVIELRDNGIEHFNASGGTPLGQALEMAKDYIEDREETKGSDYTPAVVLVSDGFPNDSWEYPLDKFIKEGRSSKAQRIAVPIGADADYDMLRKFTGDPAMVFPAENAGDIAESFKKVTMSISMHARSKPRDSVPNSGASFDKTSVSVQRKSVRSVRASKNNNDDDDDLDI